MLTIGTGIDGLEISDWNIMSCVSKKLDTLRLLIGLLMMVGDASFWGSALSQDDSAAFHLGNLIGKTNYPNQE